MGSRRVKNSHRRVGQGTADIRVTDEGTLDTMNKRKLEERADFKEMLRLGFLMNWTAREGHHEGRGWSISSGDGCSWEAGYFYVISLE